MVISTGSSIAPNTPVRNFSASCFICCTCSSVRTTGFLGSGFGCASFAANQTINTDLVVVRRRFCRPLCCRSRRRTRQKVVLLEKNPYVGGNSQHAEGLFAVDSEWNRLRSDPLTRQQAYEAFIKKQNHLVDPYKNKDFVEGSGENISWLASHGIEFEVRRETPDKDNTWHIIKNYKGTNHGAG